MNRHNLPDVVNLSDRLAGNGARVARAVEQLRIRMDSLLRAMREADWQEVERLSQDLVHGESPADTVRYRAERVCEELKKPNNLRAIKRSVVRLIGALGPGKTATEEDAKAQKPGV